MLRRSIWLWAIALALLKLWAIAHLPIRAFPATHDHLRYVIVASNLLDASVPYGELVLARQPGYPGFIALSYLLGIPLRIFQEFFYLAAGGFLAAALYRWVRRPQIVLLWLVLYNFAPFSYHWNRQTLQEVLYLPLTAAIVAGLLNLLKDSDNPRRFLLDSLILGLILALFWNTRPEGIWIVPTIALIYGILGISAISKTRKHPKALSPSSPLPLSPSSPLPLSPSSPLPLSPSSPLPLSPSPSLRTLTYSILFTLAPIVFVTSTFAFANYLQYGIYNTYDLKAPGLTAAYSSLRRVSPERHRPQIAIPRETREEIYAVSPSFERLQDSLEIESDRGWRQVSCEMGICEDYAAGVFFWALRDAVEEEGYYQSAPETEAFYEQIALEIETACDRDLLRCKSRNIASFVPSLSWDILQPWLQSSLRLSYNLTTSSLPLKLDSGVEDIAFRQRYYSHITREPADFFRRRAFPLNQLKDRLITAVSDLYRLAFPAIFGLAVLGYGLELLAFGTPRLVPLWLSGVLLFCIATRVVLVAYIDVTSWSVEGGDRYLRPVLPLLWCLMSLGVFYLSCRWKTLESSLSRR
ncbi:hypothetical protein [Baaleninema simplex]|uniref:hypothetical protein n=1 Tax=Baaleninema simplex TaxID=2862350 RepID=UPI00130E374D|nr:hypothetical protein [Baaleninema simplex]